MGLRDMICLREYPSYITDRRGPAGGIRYEHCLALHWRRWVENMFLLGNSSNSIQLSIHPQTILTILLMCSELYPHIQPPITFRTFALAERPLAVLMCSQRISCAAMVGHSSASPVWYGSGVGVHGADLRPMYNLEYSSRAFQVTYLISFPSSSYPSQHLRHPPAP